MPRRRVVWPVTRLSDAPLVVTEPAEPPGIPEVDVAESAAPEPAETTPPEAVAKEADIAALEQTRDDTDEGWSERRETSADDAWLTSQRPPHWE